MSTASMSKHWIDTRCGEPRVDGLGRRKSSFSDSSSSSAGTASGRRRIRRGADDGRGVQAFRRRRAHPHRFRHTLASEILGKGGTIEEVAGILADSPATIRRHYAKWTPEYQARQDGVIGKIHGTDLAQAEEQVSKC